MRKYVFFSILIILTCGQVKTQNLLHATVEIGDVNVSNLKPGDEITVPIKMLTKSEGLIAVFQLFVNFDHTILRWNSTWQDPLSGVRNFHPKLPYSEASWLINDNGNQFVAIWDDPLFKGVEIAAGEQFFEIVFVYVGGLEKGGEALLSWGDTFEDIDGKLVRGKTIIYDLDGNMYELTMLSGVLRNL